MSVVGSDARGLGLRGLGPADLAAVGGDGGVERHVLRLERRHPEPARAKIRQNAAASRLLPTPDDVPCTIRHAARLNG